MNVKHLIKENFKTTAWSGGTTTELFIWPIGSDFKKDDYSFRLSKATIEVENSTFTKFPGVKRVFTLLSGKVKLSHENQHDSNLKALQQDIFFGDWTTLSEGRCSPLNLMMRGATSGTVDAHTIDETGLLEFNPCPGTNILLFYPHNNNCLINLDKQYHVEHGDLIVIENLSTPKVTISAPIGANIICLQIQV